MPDFPLVSIVTCSYNNSKFIIDTLDSIKNQTYPNIELVIVDDCSTDDSVRLIDNWLKTYKGRYKFIKHEVNKGGGITYNVGLNNATGKYYAAIDSDDVMLPEKIARQVQILEESGDKVAAVYSDAYVIDVNGAPIDGLFIQRHRKFSSIPSGNIYPELLQGNYIPVLSLLVKRSVFTELGGYDESLVYGDYDMWLRIACKYEILFSEFISGKYRIRPGSMSFTIRNWDYSNVKIFLKHVDAPLPADWLCNIAWHVYENNDKLTMPLIRELACKTKNKSLITIYLLWQLTVPVKFGHAMHERVNGHIANGLSPNIVNAGETDLGIFLNEIVYSIPIDLFKEVASVSYLENREKTMQLINEVAKKTNDRYLVTAYLLWKFRVSHTIGEVLLANIDESMAAGLPSKVSNAGDTDSMIFLNDIVPAIPDGLLKEIVSSIYVEDNNDIIPLINELANKTGDRYFKTAYLLWKFRVSPVVGKLVLAEVNASVNGGLPGTINSIDAPDSEIFLKEVVPAISTGLLKKIAFEAYRNGNLDTMFLIKDLAYKMGDRYLMTMHLLVQLKIVPPIGQEILSELSERLSKGYPPTIKEYKEADTGLFIKEVIPAISFELSKKIAAKAYHDNNVLFLPIIRKLAKQSGNRYFKAVLELWKFKINTHTGEIILNRIDGYCRDKKSDLYIDICIYKDIFGAIRTRNSSLFR